MASNLQKKQFVATMLMICLSASRAWSRSLQDDAIARRHETWMAQRGRVYKDDVEQEIRLQIFKENVEYIESFNQAANRSYELAINEFADLTDEEFHASRTGYKAASGSRIRPSSSGGATNFKYENVDDVPESVDWRLRGAVNPIKNQGTCGCCWAFSAVAAMEGIVKIATGNLLSLSEQELVDCNRIGNHGCTGGNMDQAFNYIIHKKGGLNTEANYPYLNKDQGTCDAQKAYINIANISNYEDVPANSEQALLRAVANQPVSVGIDASCSAFKFYSSGVLTGGCGTNLIHAAVVVGYGTADDGTKYWLVRNSWGAGWGENGYIRIQRDVAAREGVCGIAMAASYPIA